MDNKILGSFWRSSAKVDIKINEYLGVTFAWMLPEEGWDPNTVTIKRRKILSPFPTYLTSSTSSPTGMYDFSNHHHYPDYLDCTYLFEEKARWGARLLSEITQRRKLIAFGVIDATSQ